MATHLDPEAEANAKFYTDQLHQSNSPSDRDSSWSFRLLYIEPGHFGHAISASLKTCELLNAPPYKALSYSWGERAGLEIIHLDRVFHFRVRRNLENALQRLRHPSETVCVWIDGICINQADTKERSSQVRQMGDIYSHADEVLVWLGETRPLPSAEPPIYGDAIGLFQQGDKVWWKRLWVVQESTSAGKTPIFLFRDKVMDWRSFLEEWRELCLITTTNKQEAIQSPEGKFFDDGLAALKMLGDLWTAGPGRSSLYRMLVRTQGYVCSDDHDRIYALLHLLHEADQRTFAPDYDRPLLQLYAEATVHFIKTETKAFGILLQHWYRGCETWPHAWWLDFTRPLHQHSMPFLYSRQDAGTSMPLEVEMSIIRGATGNSIQPRLHAKGFLFDEINMTRPFRSFFDPKTGEFDILRLVNFFKHIRLREKAGYLTHFNKSRDKSSYKQRIVPIHMKAIRLGVIKSLLMLYRTYAEDLSPRMKQSLDALEASPEDVLRPTTKELDTPDVCMVDRLDKDYVEQLSFVVQRALRMLGSYDIFITTLGFVGFSRSTQNPQNESRTDRAAAFRAPLPRDIVVVLRGGSFPFIFRRPEEQSTSLADKFAAWNWSTRKEETSRLFSIVDGCCLPAIMGGEIVDLAQKGEVQSECFTLGEPFRRRRRASRDLLSPGASEDGSSMASPGTSKESLRESRLLRE